MLRPSCQSLLCFGVTAFLARKRRFADSLLEGAGSNSSDRFISPLLISRQREIVGANVNGHLRGRRASLRPREFESGSLQRGVSNEPCGCGEFLWNERLSRTLPPEAAGGAVIPEMGFELRGGRTLHLAAIPVWRTRYGEGNCRSLDGSRRIRRASRAHPSPWRDFLSSISSGTCEAIAARVFIRVRVWVSSPPRRFLWRGRISVTARGRFLFRMQAFNAGVC
jgi:hypothetical protein